MKNKDGLDQQEVDVPQEAVDAWAEVYIDVAEKLDAEEQATAATTNNDTKEQACPSASNPTPN